MQRWLHSLLRLSLHYTNSYLRFWRPEPTLPGSGGPGSGRSAEVQLLPALIANPAIDPWRPEPILLAQVALAADEALAAVAAHAPAAACLPKLLAGLPHVGREQDPQSETTQVYFATAPPTVLLALSRCFKADRA